MATKMGHGQKAMASAFLAEATYDAGVTMDASNAFSLNGFTIATDWPDDVQNDSEEITGSEYPTEQTIVEKRVNITVGQPKAKPNDLVFMGALTLGAVASAKDGAFTGYKHTITDAAIAADLPSIQLEHSFEAPQYAYKGLKSNSLKISGEPGGIVNLDCELMGSGTRDISATAFVPKISESWMLWNQAKIWLEDGANITIVAAGSQVQEVENISSATPDDVKATMKSFEITRMNNLEPIPGFGGAGVLQDLQMGRRSTELTFTLRFTGQVDFDRFINQNAHALEINLAGALIDAGGAFKYGGIMTVPSFKINKAPIPQAGPGDSLEASFECTVMYDGTNDPFFMQVYNAQVAYLA